MKTTIKPKLSSRDRAKRAKNCKVPCPNCGKLFSKPNAKYCSVECGRKFWETVAPGKLAFLAGVRVGKGRRT